MKNEVIALVVSYNGGEDLARTVTALAAQVKKVLILDNGSDDKNQGIISELVIARNVSAVKFHSNMGIGFALNRGVEIAKAENFGWVLTMDQDSIASPQMVAEMLISAGKAPGLNAICPSLALNDVRRSPGGDQAVRYAITSGNLLPIGVFSKIGNFNEGYFIDSVDFEFSLRMRNAGIQIIQSKRGELFHKLGESILLKFASIGYRYISHSPLRRYYIFRNHMYLVSDFWRKNPIFLIKKSFVLLYQFFEIMLFDSKRKENLEMIYFGLRDFFKGRDGRFDG